MIDNHTTFFRVLTIRKTNFIIQFYNCNEKEFCNFADVIKMFYRSREDFSRYE